MKIFEMSVSVNKDEKSSEVHCVCNQGDYDPEALKMIESLVEEVSKLITIAYLHKVVSFKTEKGGEA